MGQNRSTFTQRLGQHSTSQGHQCNTLHTRLQWAHCNHGLIAITGSLQSRQRRSASNSSHCTTAFRVIAPEIFRGGGANLECTNTKVSCNGRILIDTNYASVWYRASIDLHVREYHETEQKRCWVVQWSKGGVTWIQSVYAVTERSCT